MNLLLAFIAVLAAAVAAAQQPVPSHTPGAAPHQPARDVALVNRVPIRDDRLALAVNALLPLEAFHRSVGEEKIAAVRQTALNRLIDEELRYQDGVRRGIVVTPVEVDRRLAALTRQYGGPKSLAQAEQRSGVTRSQLRREVRRALTIEKTFARTVTARCQVRREEAAQFFRDNPDRFLQPEQLHVYAITIGVDPSSAAPRWAEAKAQADEVLASLRRGASFEEMARTHSTDPSKASGGDMGFVHRGSLNEDFEQATRDLPVGQASDVIRTLYGYHIVRVADIRAARRKTFSEVSADLQKDLSARKCTELGDAWTARLRAGAVVEIPGLSPAGESEAHGRTP